MEYIVSNLDKRNEIRISDREIKGRVLYRGHRLGVPDEMLPRIILHRYERYTNSYYYLDYKIWKDKYGMCEIKSTMTDCWIKEKDSKKALLNSYNTLLEVFKDIISTSKNIYIVEN